MHADLAVRHDAEAVFEGDHGAVVQAEEIAQEVGEAALGERAREAVGDAERAAELRQAERRSAGRKW